MGERLFGKAEWQLRWNQARSRTRHDFGEGLLEGEHLVLRAHRNAHLGWPRGPDAPDEHILLRQRRLHLRARPPNIKHEAIALGRRHGITLALEPGKILGADFADLLFARGDKIRIEQAGL